MSRKKSVFLSTFLVLTALLCASVSVEAQTAPGAPDRTLFAHASELFQQERYDEAVLEAKRVWDGLSASADTDSEFRYESGMLYARCLFEVEAWRELAYVCHRLLVLQHEMNTTNPAVQKDTGWLKYWFGEAELDQKNPQMARRDAVEAFNIGKDLGIRELMAWSRLLEGRAALDMKDILSARVVLGSCISEYVPEMPGLYQAKVTFPLAKTEVRLGNFESALSRLVDMHEKDAGDHPLQGRILDGIAAEALSRSATGVALQICCLQQEGFGKNGYWSPYSGGVWQTLKARLGSRLRPSLESVAQAQGIPGAAVNLMLAQLALEAGDNESAGSYLDAAATQISGARLAERLATLREWAAGTPPLTSDSAIFAIIKSYPSERAMYFFRIREREGENYGNWLERHKEEFSELDYLTQKGIWLYSMAYVGPGPGEPTHAKGVNGCYYANRYHRNAEAKEVLESALKIATRLEDRETLYNCLVPVLIRLGEDYHPLLEQFLNENIYPHRRCWRLATMGEAVSGVTIGCLNPRDYNLDAAEDLYDLCISMNEEERWVRQTYFYKARLLLYQKRYDEAIEAYSNVANRLPLEVDNIGGPVGKCIIGLGNTFQKKGEPRQAESYYRELIDNLDYYNCEDTPEAFLNLATLLFKEKRYREVIEVAKQMPAKSERHPYAIRHVHEIAGESALASNDLLSAQRHYNWLRTCGDPGLQEKALNALREHNLLVEAE